MMAWRCSKIPSPLAVRPKAGGEGASRQRREAGEGAPHGRAFRFAARRDLCVIAKTVRVATTVIRDIRSAATHPTGEPLP